MVGGGSRKLSQLTPFNGPFFCPNEITGKTTLCKNYTNVLKRRPLEYPERRKFSRGISRKPITLLKKLRKAKKETAYGEKPEASEFGIPSDTAVVSSNRGEYADPVSACWMPVLRLRGLLRFRGCGS